MTTLPQTTPLRLPRPAASTQLSIPGPSLAPALGAPGSAGFQMTGGDVWRVLRSNSWLIILMVIVFAGAGYALNVWLAKTHSRYTASGIVQVVAPWNNDPLRGPQTDMIQPMTLQLKTEAKLLRDPSLITKVLSNPNGEIRSTKWFQQFATIALAKTDLALHFAVIPNLDTNLLDVQMTCGDPDSAKVIVESIVDQHIRDEQGISRDHEYNRTLALNNAKAQFESRIRELHSSIADLESKLNISGVLGTNNRISERDLELQQLVDLTLKGKMALASAQEDFNNINRQISADQDPPSVQTSIFSDPEVLNYRTAVNNLDLAISEALSRFLPDHPSVVDLKGRKDLMERKLNTATTEARLRYRTAITEQLHAKVLEAQRELDATTKRIEAINNDMADLSNLMATCLTKQSEVAAYESKVKTIDEQLYQIANYSAKQENSRVELLSPPEKPETASFPVLSQTIALSITVGLALGLGIAFLRELMDTTIRSPRDISRVGNINLLGMVPHEDDDPQSAGARLPMVIFEAPHSMMAEQLRQVRTRLQHSSSLDTTRSILVTSPSPGDGKSTIACNLASGLALNGRRILLVDANFRRPELHRMFNLGNGLGFSDVLNHLDHFDQAIQETQVPNLFVLPSGPKPTNATELLESQLLTDFIERTLEEFDHVIFDSGPLLFVSETVALAPRVDGVVTVVRARTNSRGVLTRMKDSLRQIKAEHLGVVLNAVRAQGGGYYRRNIRTYYEYQDGNGAA